MWLGRSSATLISGHRPPTSHSRRAGRSPARSTICVGRDVARSGLPQRPRTLAPPSGIAPLAGYTVAVASDRRRHPLAGLLEAAGAKVASVQAIRAASEAD